MDPEEFYKRETSYIKKPEDDPDFPTALEAFKALSSYVSGGYEDGESFDNLNKYLEEIESKYQSKERNRIFYLALPPSVFIPVSKNVKEHCYVPRNGTNRIIIEKPFGKDTESAKELLGAVKTYWTEDETFRIDHYLGKEMVKNLLVLRFANVAMGAAWDKNSISNVQITFKEPFGTEGRGGYFDEFGIIRDVLQNREAIDSLSSRFFTLTDGFGIDLLQVLSILTMERPVSFAAEDIRDEKVRLSQAIRGTECLMCINRLKFFVQFRPLNRRIASLASTLGPTASPDTLMMTPSHPTPTAPPLLPALCGSTIHDGKVYPSS